MRVILTITTLFGLLFVSGSFATVNSTRRSQSTNLRPHRSPFRYVITSNDVVGRGRKRRGSYRTVGVLLEEKAFSEENLKVLFNLLTRRFVQPNDMNVWVSTNLEQIPTPEESEAGARSEAPDSPTLDRYPTALFIRKHGNELFRYTPNPPSTEVKTVILKGRDLQAARIN